MIKRILILWFFLAVILTVRGQMDDRFYHPSKDWISVEGLAYDNIYLKVDSVDTIHTILVRPVGKPKATIVFCHGNGGNISQNVKSIRPLIKAGYQIYMIDYRGYGKSTGKSSHLNVAADVQLAFDSLLLREEVKNLPILVYGSSLGTQVATHLVRNNNSKIVGLVLDSAMASFTDVAVATSPATMSELIRQYVVSPYSAKEDIKAIKDVRLLCIHSREDPIPFEGAQEIFRNATCPKTFWEYKGGHIEASLLYPDVWVKYIDDLLIPVK